MEIIQNKSLIELNTFGIDVLAKYYTSIESIKDLKYLLENPIYKENKLFIISVSFPLVSTLINLPFLLFELARI